MSAFEHLTLCMGQRKVLKAIKINIPICLRCSLWPAIGNGQWTYWWLPAARLNREWPRPSPVPRAIQWKLRSVSLTPDPRGDCLLLSVVSMFSYSNVPMGFFLAWRPFSRGPTFSKYRYFQVFFGNKTLVNKIVMQKGSGYTHHPTQLSLKYSNDGYSWQTAETVCIIPSLLVFVSLLWNVSQWEPAEQLFGLLFTLKLWP